MAWYVVATKPNAEKKARLNLEHQGFDVFLPLIAKRRRHARRIDTVHRPLFPGYLFVRFDRATAPWRAINGTFGVLHILMAEGIPQPIRDDFIAKLHECSGAGGVITLAAEALKAGDRVEIMEGVMGGQVATILEADANGRVKILLSMMGGDVVSSIAAGQLEKAG